MESNIEIVNEIQNEFVRKEYIFNNVNAINRYFKNNLENIMYINIRSLNANFNRLQILIDSLDIKPFIIVCTETRILDCYKYFSIPGYKIYYNKSTINQCDGVVVYISDTLTEHTETIQIGKLKILHTSFNVDNRDKIQISALYRSHDLSKPEFTISLKKFMRDKQNVKNHFIIGDFNIDLLNLDCIGQEYLNNFMEKGFIPGFQTITRPATTSDKGSCIDNIFIKTSTLKINTCKLCYNMTDHYPLFLTIKKLKINNWRKAETKIDYTKLKKLASKEKWNEVMSIPDPNLATNILISKIKKCTESATNTRDSNKRLLHSVPRNAWITKAIITSCNTKETLYKTWKLQPNNISAKSEYKRYDKILNKVIKDAKVMYDRSQVEQNSHDPKKLWNLINQKLGKNKKQNTPITKIYHKNNQAVTDTKEIADTMNIFFSNIGQELSDKIQTPNNAQLKMPASNPKSIFLYPTDYHEITNIINNLKLKNGGVDNINTKTIKTLATYIIEPLEYIFNLCIETSIWPDALKNAEIIPIYKSSNKNYPQNYRPISLISNLAKILEKIIYNRLYNFITSCNILSNNQYGFVRNKGTKDALQRITNILYNNLDKSKPTAITFLDLAKAFDTVNHKLLLKKLHCYGIRGNAYKLISNYLNNRQQRVKIKDKISDSMNVNTGVPQGTVLGPLLFILYINDMLKENIISYADDTAIIVEDNTWSGVENKMNKEIKNVSKWFALNKLSLNTDKTTYITFGNYQDSVPTKFKIQYENVVLKRVDSCKYLGIMFDSNLKWDKHINYLYSKTKYLVFVFYKLARIMNLETMRLIYYALFNSIIGYGIIAWGGAYHNSLNLLMNLQKRLLKIIHKNQFITTKNPLNISQLFALETLYYHYNTLESKYMNSDSITRNKNIILPKCHKKISNKNSYIYATKLFNLLPNSLKNIRTKNRKKLLKNWIATIIS